MDNDTKWAISCIAIIVGAVIMFVLWFTSHVVQEYCGPDAVMVRAVGLQEDVCIKKSALYYANH
jgi:hypothetical protein